ncbi:MAG TPA: hypothetical protein PLE28_00745 [bacterium]|nr:hypothetical protein [bacterium]
MELIKEAEIKEIRQQKITNNQFPLVKRRIDEFNNCFYGLTKQGAQFTIQNTELALNTAVERINEMANNLFDETIFPRIVFKKKSKELISNYSEKHFIFDQDKMFSQELKKLVPGYRLVIEDLDGIINSVNLSSKKEVVQTSTLGHGTVAVFFKQFLKHETKINITLLSQSQIFKYLKTNISKLDKKNTYAFFCQRNSFKKSSLDNIIVFIINKEKKEFKVTSLKNKKIYKDIIIVS